MFCGLQLVFFSRISLSESDILGHKEARKRRHYCMRPRFLFARSFTLQFREPEGSAPLHGKTSHVVKLDTLLFSVF